MDIKFNEPKPIMSQRTLAKILEKHKYYFEPINDYTDELFYCIIKCEKRHEFLEFLYKIFRMRFLKPKEEYIDTPLEFHVANLSYQEFIPLVIDKEEIIKIIKDVPENYAGEKVL